MLPCTRQDITKVVDIVLENYDIQIPIDDINDVVVKMRGRIEFSNDYLLDGVIEKVDENDTLFVIKIADFQEVGRFNNAVASLIGHLVLHMGYGTDWDKWEKYNNDDSLVGFTVNSFQSQEFATNFLMPRKQYLDFVYEHSSNQVIDSKLIANYFHVTNYAVVNRGRWLGAIRWR